MGFGPFRSLGTKFERLWQFKGKVMSGSMLPGVPSSKFAGMIPIYSNLKACMLGSCVRDLQFMVLERAKSGVYPSTTILGMRIAMPARKFLTTTTMTAELR